MYFEGCSSFQTGEDLVDVELHDIPIPCLRGQGMRIRCAVLVEDGVDFVGVVADQFQRIVLLFRVRCVPSERDKNHIGFATLFQNDRSVHLKSKNNPSVMLSHDSSLYTREPLLGLFRSMFMTTIAF